MERTSGLGRLALVAVLAVLCAAGSAYLRAVYQTGAVYTHFAYVPALLAAMWWGWRGLGVAALLGAAFLSFHLLGFAGSPLGDDLARAAFLLLAGACVAALSERAAAGRRAASLSEQRYRLLIEKSLTGILLYEHDSFRITFASRRLGELLGRRPEEFLGRSVWDLFAAEDQPRVRALVAERREKGFTDLHYEARLLRADGTILWADVLSSVATEGGETRVLVNVYDITARKEAEAKRQELAELARKQEDQLVHSTRLAELGEMAAAVAHDLNQPLTGIKNFARNALYMLERGAGSPAEVAENLRLIAEQVDRAARIITQMRGMTRKAERQMALVDLNAIVRESVEFLMPQMRLSGVEARLDLAPNLPSILGDKTRLEQVFLNLLTNARQAMEEAPTRCLTVRTAFADGTRPITAVVADTGRGFSPEEARKLFTPFYSTKKHGHGTGLGLTISERIIRDHGGVILAEGEPGKGARFTIRLPLPAPEAVQEALQQA